MKATKWEFENRAWLFGVIFGVAFFLYVLDSKNSSSVLADWIGRVLRTNPDGVVRLLFAAAAFLLVIAAFTRTWASSFLQADVVYATEIKTAALVADGPYRQVRNPLYFANVLMAVGMGSLMSRAGFIVCVVVMVVYSYRLIFREEAELRASRGESYEHYLQAVPRLWPALTPRVPSSGAKPQWGAGFKAEAWYWGFALAVLAFAVTLNFKVFAGILVASVALLWISSYLLQKRTEE